MKLILLSSLLAIVIAGCGTTRPIQPSTDAVTVITVEYRYDPSSEQSIRHLLRTRRVADWTATNAGTERTIEARYRQLSAAEVGEIDARLRELPAVIRVDVRKDGVPVKNIN